MDAVNLGLFWGTNFMTQEMLPAKLLDTNFQSIAIDTPERSQPPLMSKSSQFSSRLPSLDDIQDDAAQESDVAEGITGTDAEPWSITEADYKTFCLRVQYYSAMLLNGYSLPSRTTLIRYLEKYLRCVQEFLPFIHIATFSVETKDVELLLAMASLGSLYLFEHPKHHELYFMAKAILMETIRREDLQMASGLVSGECHSTLKKKESLGRMQTFILLISFASWADHKILPDALSMGGQLTVLVRENGISEPDKMPQDVDWISWVAVEEKRRTLLAAYVLFNLHSIAYDTPPLILNHEVGVCLPGYAEQWKAKSATQWQQATYQVERPFRDGLRSCLDGTGIPKEASVSSFSNYILIHGLLQQIYIDRHGFTAPVQSNTVKSLETSLRTWQLSWECTHESSLDLMSPNAPFGLTSAALFRIAYIRLVLPYLDPCRLLLSRDPERIIDKRSSLTRSPQIDKAILHAAHALSIPVRQGIAYLALTKTPLWNIEHSLCSLECGLLLKDWLEMISTTTRSCGTDGLRSTERRLLDIITGIIKETSYANTLDILEDDASHFQRMSITVVKLWAQIFQGVHILDIDNVIGARLQCLSNTSPH
jgi:hypothetical protein